MCFKKTAIIVPVVYMLIVLAIHFSMDAWHDEFGGHADEAGHYITGLMVRDYVASGLTSAPMTFAESYYLHYPKVALGHWPPLFYAALAPWMLVFEPARMQLMLFMALVTVLSAVYVYSVSTRLLGRPLGFMAGLFFLGLPLVRQYSALLMSDIFNAGLCFAAAVWFGRFMDTVRRRDAMIFGLLSAAAILTKGSALGLALIPPLGIMLTGRWALLRRPVFWMPAVLVAVLCAPWYWLALPMMKNGFENPQGLASSLYAVTFYSRYFLRIFGPLLLFLAGLGAVAELRQKSESDQPAVGNRGIWAGLTALTLAIPIFHCIVTNAFDVRYLLPVFPAMVILILGGARRLYVICRRSWREYPATAVIGLAIGLVIFVRLAVPARFAGGAGYGMVAADLIAAAPGEGRAWLVSSDARGEGMFIVQAAMRDDRRPSNYALRASKTLADSLWDGRDYVPLFADSGSLRDFLITTPVSAVIIDETMPAHRRQPHHALLEQTMLDFPDQFRKRNSYPLTRDGIFHPAGLTVYETVLPDDAPPLSMELNLERMLGRRLALP